MNIANKIKQYLAAEFHTEFNVSKKDSANEEYIIKIINSNDRYFYLDVIIKDDIRLTILCEPEKYGANFVDLINKADEYKRTIFCDFWQQLGKNHLTVKINDIPVSSEWIKDKNNEWRRFSLKYTKAPFFEEKDDRDSMINYTISNVLSMILSLTTYSIEGEEEGKVKTILQTKHERNPINRQLCLLIKGYKCSVCGFDFFKTYGEIGRDFIEVHHAIPVASMGKGHVVDIKEELFPVCSNCHSMLHRQNPPLSIEELKQRINHD